MRVMRFKVGDKVRTTKLNDPCGTALFPIGTIGVVTTVDTSLCSLPYAVEAEGITYWYDEDMLEPYEEKVEEQSCEKTYKQGLADAWALAKKLVFCKDMGGLSTEELDEIFGSAYPEDVFDNYTYEEVIAKVAEYEERTKITPSKIVEDSEGTRALVLDDYGEGVYFVFTENGCVENWQRERCVSVVDHTIDVSELAKRIGER